MKKTIAKIMAAAVALSTVVAPNVSATSTIPGNGSSILESFGIYAETEDKDYDLTSKGAGSTTNPVETTIEKANKNSLGYYTYIDTDLSLYESAYYTNSDNDLVWFDGENLVIARSTNAVTVSDAQVKVLKGDTTGNTTDTATNYTVNKLKVSEMVDGNDTSLPANQQARKVVEYLASSNGNNLLTTNSLSVSEMENLIKYATFTTYNSGVAVTSDSEYKDTWYGSSLFEGIEITDKGKIRLIVDPSAANTAIIDKAINSVDPILTAINIRLQDNTRVNDGEVLENNVTRTIVVKLSKGSIGDYTHYVLLKHDNNNYTQVGVNITKDSNHYATIESADTGKLELDTAKGGRLLLDYVYERGVAWRTADLSKASTTDQIGTYKIRRIGSRVFKGGKFQQISGRDDDGAKFIRIINNGAFRKCKQLKKVNLDTNKKLRKINSKAFYDCKKLATVKLDGRNLKAIGSGAFKNCKSNITFKIKGNKNQVAKAWKKIKKQAPSKAKYSKI